MGIMRSTLRRLFPRGPAWRLTGTMGALIDALAASLERAREYARGIVDESLPSTATDTLDRWFRMLGLPYDATQTLSTRRQRARQAYTAVGGQNKAYLESTIQQAYPDVELEEPDFRTGDMVGIGMAGQAEVTNYAPWVPGAAQDGTYPVEYFRLIGSVQNTYERNGLAGIFSRIQPAHLRAIYDVTILNATETSEVGLALTGLAEVGKTKED